MKTNHRKLYNNTRHAWSAAPFIARNILWIDSFAAMLAGVLVLVLSSWLSDLYAISQHLLLFIGVVNLVYGFYSFSLAIRTKRDRRLLKLFIAANATWALICIVLAIGHGGSMTLFGHIHLYAEALFVGTLAALEWRWLAQLTASSAD